jgi:hypothetical protein
MRRLAGTALALLAACGPAPSVLTPSPGSPRLLAGAPTVVVLRVEPGCADLGALAVEMADGGAAPAWLGVAADRFLTTTATGNYAPGNPGQGQPWDMGGDGSCGIIFDPDGATFTDPACLPGAPGGRVLGSSFDGFQLILTPAAAAPVGPVALQVRVSGCGRTWTGSLSPEVVGADDLAGFCGWSTGEPCAADADCARVGSYGQVCGAAASGPSPAHPVLSCSDPVPSGARCGCVAGTCAWRLP